MNLVARDDCVQCDNLRALRQVLFVLPFGNVNARVMHWSLIHQLSLREVLHLSVCHLSATQTHIDAWFCPTHTSICVPL